MKWILSESSTSTRYEPHRLVSPDIPCVASLLDDEIRTSPAALNRGTVTPGRRHHQCHKVAWSLAEKGSSTSNVEFTRKPQPECHLGRRHMHTRRWILVPRRIRSSQVGRRSIELANPDSPSSIRITSKRSSTGGCVRTAVVDRKTPLLWPRPWILICMSAPEPS